MLPKLAIWNFGSGDADNLLEPSSELPSTEDSADEDLWLDASEEDELLFLDEDDILDEDLTAEELSGEQVADLSFESTDDLLAADADLRPTALMDQSETVPPKA